MRQNDLRSLPVRIRRRGRHPLQLRVDDGRRRCGLLLCSGCGVLLWLRGGPSTDDEILGYFDNREYVSILGSMDGWYHVRRADGTECWVSGDFCKQI